MQLLIEAGNTYVKVAQLFDDGNFELLGRYPSRKLGIFPLVACPKIAMGQRCCFSESLFGTSQIQCNFPKKQSILGRPAGGEGLYDQLEDVYIPRR